MNEHISIQQHAPRCNEHTFTCTCETWSIALNRYKYKNRKRMHIRHSKTVGVQTIMLKHPIKQKKEHQQNQQTASPYIQITHNTN